MIFITSLQPGLFLSLSETHSFLLTHLIPILSQLNPLKASSITTLKSNHNSKLINSQFINNSQKFNFEDYVKRKIHLFN